jgi:hypothetical protein
MCCCGCEMALVLAGHDRPSRELDGNAERPMRSQPPLDRGPTVGGWESFKLALHRAARDRAAAVHGRVLAEPT